MATGVLALRAFLEKTARFHSMTALRNRARTEERASLVETGLAACVNRVTPV